MGAEGRDTPEDGTDIRVVDDVLEHDDPHRNAARAHAGKEFGHRYQGRPVHRRECASMEVESRDRAQHISVGDIHGDVTVLPRAHLG